MSIAALFSDAAAAWGPFALDLALQLSVTIVVVGVLVRLLRRVAPQWRHLLWLGVLLRMAVPIRLSHGWGLLPSADLAAPEQGAATATVAGEIMVQAATVPAQASWSPIHILFASWIIGILLLALAVGARALAAMRMARHGRPPSPSLRNTVARLARRVGLADVPEIRLIAKHRIATPAILGVRRPMLLIPEGLFARCSEDQRDAILLHELVHLVRRDHWANAAQVLVQILYFPHPLVWWAMRRLYRERELVCDDEVIRMTKDPTTYMRALIEAASFASKHRARWAIGVPFARKATLLQRRIQIMAAKKSSVSSRRIPLAARALLVGAALLLPWAVAAETAKPKAIVPPPPAAGDAGFVVLQLEISESGAVTRAEVLEEFPPQLGLGKKAKRRALKWKYDPQFDRDGRPAKNSLTVRIPARTLVGAPEMHDPHQDLRDPKMHDPNLDLGDHGPKPALPAPPPPSASAAPPPPRPERFDPPRPADADQDGPFLAGIDGVENPEILEATRVMPEYPLLAKRARVEGKVYLQVVIDREGYPRDITVRKEPAAGLGFAEAAIDAVRQWRYRPATKNGEAVDVYITVFVTFSLEDGSGADKEGGSEPRDLGDPI